jgi:hypothetical protein
VSNLVEAHPAEQQDESSGDDVDQIVRGMPELYHRRRTCQLRPENTEAPSRRSPYSVHHGRSGEIHVAVTEVHGRAELGHPAAAPHPAAEHRVENSAHEQFAQDEGPEVDAFANRTDDDVSGGFMNTIQTG